MFTKSRTDQAKAQVQDAASSAGQVLREKVAPVVAAKAHDAKDWAAPRVERGIEVAAPKVEAAVDKVTPAVDAARDKIVDDLLPRLVDAVNAAAAAAASSGVAEHTEEARTRAKGAAAVLKGDAVAKRKHGKLRKLALITGILAAIGAAVAAFKKQQGPHEDPWAVPASSYPSAGGSSSSSSSSSSTGSSTGTSSGSGSTSGTSTSTALDSGAAGDALDNGGTAEVPGMTEESTAAAEAIAESAGNDSPKKQGDPLTDPIEDVEGSSKKKS